jgi:hypothetical protein
MSSYPEEATLLARAERGGNRKLDAVVSWQGPDITYPARTGSQLELGRLGVQAFHIQHPGRGSGIRWLGGTHMNYRTAGACLHGKPFPGPETHMVQNILGLLLLNEKSFVGGKVQGKRQQ